MHQRGQTERKTNPANPLGAPRPRAADHGVRGASAERIGLFRAIRIVARVHPSDATRPVPEVLSVALVAGNGRGDAQEIEMSG
jgi:hypothetical protein